MPRLEQAPSAVWDQGKAIMEKYHKDLHAVGVKIEYLFAFAPEPDDGEIRVPALKLHGYPCSGIVKIINLEGRVMGRQDAAIIVDGDRWGDLPDEEQNALLDHEISHLQVSRKVSGEVILDHAGRPKLKMRLHDYQHGWFTHIAERHGANSMEVKQAVQFHEEVGAIYFEFVKDLEPRPLTGLKALA